MASKATCSSVQQKAIFSTTEVVKDLLSLPKTKDDPVLVASTSKPSHQDIVHSRLGQKVFQNLFFFGSTQQFHQGEPLHRAQSSHVIPR